MKILGKEVRINPDIEFGIIEDLQIKGDKDPLVMKAFLHAVTGLSYKEIRRIKQSLIFEIIAEYHKASKKQQTDFKKKLTLS